MASYELSKVKIQTRLRRIEGQTRGLQRMVAEDKYCVEILTQIRSVEAALEQVSLLLVEDHLRHCVKEAVEEGNGAGKIREVVDAIRHYTRA